MNVTEELERLQTLHATGALTESEYAKAKANVLNATAPNLPAARSFESSYSPEGNFLQTLRRSSTDAVLGGVCGGLGTNTPLPSWAWRVIFILSIFIGGIGLILYIVLWICIPKEERGY